MTFVTIGSERAPGILGGCPAVAPSTLSTNSVETEFLRVLARHRLAFGTRADFHHVPGRLRLKADALKQDTCGLEAICNEFAAAAGVRSATPNRLTGSIVVDYDPFVLSPSALSAALPECRGTTAGDSAPGFDYWAEHIAPKAIEWLLEKLAVALIAAMV